jgi:cellulose synthase/poly-beta-1,6-N-acetylglucosamine synthase-like glycosyltransferase
MIKFSVIIPARGISDFLKESFIHLQNLEYNDYEVIIVTDEEVKDTPELSDKFIFLSSNGSGNPNVKRNLAAQKATGDVLVFMDDDAYPRSDWLTEAAKLFEDSSLYALGGPAVTPKDAKFLEQMSGKVLESWMASGGTTYRHIPSTERDIDDYPTVNLFVRHEAFDRVGGFSLEFWPGEDTKLCLDLIKAYGRKFKYSPKPVVYHHRRNLFASHLKQISRYGRHRGQFARIFPENSRILSYFMPSLFILGLIRGPFAAVLLPILKPIYYSIVGLYILLLLLEARAQKNIESGVYVALGIFLTHLIYGTNFIVGFIKRPKLKLKAVDTKTGNYAEG